MNLYDLVMGSIPLLSALLSVIAAITMSIYKRHLSSKHIEDIQEITCQINKQETQNAAYSEEESMKIIIKELDKENLQYKDSSEIEKEK